MNAAAGHAGAFRYNETGLIWLLRGVGGAHFGSSRNREPDWRRHRLPQERRACILPDVKRRASHFASVHLRHFFIMKKVFAE